KGKLPATDGGGATCPFRYHEWGFIRLCLHLAHRAVAAGWPVRPLDVFDGNAYGLSPTWPYARALGDEPERLEDYSLSIVQKLPPPAAFAALWREDTLKIFTKIPDHELSRMMASGRVFIPRTER